jgi:DNA-binding response OmpR family regulator
MKNRILIVEDEPNMLVGLKHNLEFEGYEVDEAITGTEGLEKGRKAHHDLILLDVMLPGMSGFDVCKQLRAENVLTPIIMLTSKAEEVDKVIGLELGADDYITKPFSIRELLARLKAVLRRRPAVSSGGEIVLGQLTVDFAGYKAKRQDGTIEHLSHKEFEILQHLWKNQNQIVSRRDLLEEVWGYNETPTTRTVDNFMLKLRQKIEDSPADPQIILTVHGVGYKLVV